MKVLLLIGQDLESPEIIDALLDTEKTPGKPFYAPASEVRINGPFTVLTLLSNNRYLWFCWRQIMVMM